MKTHRRSLRNSDLVSSGREKFRKNLAFSDGYLFSVLGSQEVVVKMNIVAIFFRTVDWPRTRKLERFKVLLESTNNLFSFQQGVSLVYFFPFFSPFELPPCSPESFSSATASFFISTVRMASSACTLSFPAPSAFSLFIRSVCKTSFFFVQCILISENQFESNSGCWLSRQTQTIKPTDEILSQIIVIGARLGKPRVTKCWLVLVLNHEQSTLSCKELMMICKSSATR